MSKRWYTVHVHSNYEKRVAESVRELALRNGLEDAFDEVLVPAEEVVEVKRGKKVTANKQIMPGYILVKMDMRDDTYHLVKSLAFVTGFLGTKGKPSPLTDAEVSVFLSKAEEGESVSRPKIQFEVGEEIRVVDGPFESFSGLVEDVDAENARLKVMVSIFGRETPVELEYGQVQKA